MAGQIVADASKRPATLPNCARCGQFTSKPETVSGHTVVGNGIYCTFCELICPRCVAKGRRGN